MSVAEAMDNGAILETLPGPLRGMWRSSLEWRRALQTGQTLESRPQAAGGTASLTGLTRTSGGTAAAGGTGPTNNTPRELWAMPGISTALQWCSPSGGPVDSGGQQDLQGPQDSLLD